MLQKNLFFPNFVRAYLKKNRREPILLPFRHLFLSLHFLKFTTVWGIESWPPSMLCVAGEPAVRACDKRRAEHVCAPVLCLRGLRGAEHEVREGPHHLPEVSRSSGKRLCFRQRKQNSDSKQTENLSYGTCQRKIYGNLCLCEPPTHTFLGYFLGAGRHWLSKYWTPGPRNLPSPQPHHLSFELCVFLYF